MTEADLLALCAFEEANTEPDDGVAAIARVVLNRMARRFQSDGTITGTVFAHDQFSWVEWTMVAGRYERVARTPQAVRERAERLLAQDQAFAGRWLRARTITEAVRAGTYHGAAYDRLTDDAVLYDNLALARPAWATPDRLICAIGRHSFFRA